jgi:GcrA cell cycle regulator
MPSGHPGGWNDERVDRLKVLVAEGWSATQIARELGGGLTRNSVIGKMHRTGLKSAHTRTASAPTVKRRAATAAYAARKPASAPRVVTGEGSHTPRGAALERKLEYITTNTIAQGTWVEPVDEAGLAPIPEDQRSKSHCPWPIGDPRDPGFDCCGRDRERLEGKVLRYCETHNDLGRAAKQPSKSSTSAIMGFVRMTDNVTRIPKDRRSTLGTAWG